MLSTEVALAIRGPAYRAPFDATPPPAQPGRMTADQARSAAAGAAAAFAGRAVGLLDHTARLPLPRLATGGIGVRELAKLAKAHGSHAEVRLVLEIAAAAGLIEPGVDDVATTGLFDDWRGAAPAEQVATLIEAWWAMSSTPTEARGPDGKALRALAFGPPCQGCRDARTAVLDAAAGLPTGTPDRRGLALRALWARPLVHATEQDDAPLSAVLHECELLGVIAEGALTPIGRALRDEDGTALRAELTELLPASSDRAGFGSDLTAVVGGTPSARLTRLLDGCADRESSGGAVTWRFSPASIRRAMDDGATAEQLLDDLDGLTDRPLPQTLTYLVGDVARRHGRIRGAAVASVLRSEDEALLAEVTADRRLAALGLRLLAPTVVGCAVPLDAALNRLRAVGYFPVVDGASPRPARSPVVDEQRADVPAFRRRSTPDRTPPPPEPGQLARSLLAAGADAPSAPPSDLAGEIGTEARRLARPEVENLAELVEHGGRAQIDYESASGSVTRRVIVDPVLSGRSVVAFCELRQAERVFTLARIRSVQPL